MILVREFCFARSILPWFRNLGALLAPGYGIYEGFLLNIAGLLHVRKMCSGSFIVNSCESRGFGKLLQSCVIGIERFTVTLFGLAEIKTSYAMGYGVKSSH